MKVAVSISRAIIASTLLVSALVLGVSSEWSNRPIHQPQHTAALLVAAFQVDPYTFRLYAKESSKSETGSSMWMEAESNDTCNRLVWADAVYEDFLSLRTKLNSNQFAVAERSKNRIGFVNLVGRVWFDEVDLSKDLQKLMSERPNVANATKGWGIKTPSYMSLLQRSLPAKRFEELASAPRKVQSLSWSNNAWNVQIKFGNQEPLRFVRHAGSKNWLIVLPAK